MPNGNNDCASWVSASMVNAGSPSGQVLEAKEEAAERARWMASCLGEAVAASPTYIYTLSTKSLDPRGLCTDQVRWYFYQVNPNKIL